MLIVTTNRHKFKQLTKVGRWFTAYPYCSFHRSFEKTVDLTRLSTTCFFPIAWMCELKTRRAVILAQPDSNKSLGLTNKILIRFPQRQSGSNEKNLQQPTVLSSTRLAGMERSNRLLW